MVRRSVSHLSAAGVVLGVALSHSVAGELGTAFTYQGRLRQAGVEVDDNCDFEFRLFDTLAGGVQIGPTLTFDGVGGNAPPVTVVEGLFTVKLDFGMNAFEGEARFLDISVRCPSGTGGYTLLNPRQPICAAPYALYALDSPPDFNLPLEVTLPFDGPLLSLINPQGSGGAAAFRGTVDGAGAAIEGRANGDGVAGNFVNDDGTSISPALRAEHGGTGPTINSTNTGDGPAGLFTSSGTNSESTLNVLNSAMGRAGLFSVINEDSQANALEVVTDAAGDGLACSTTGQGRAGYFRVNVPEEGAGVVPALVAETNSDGAGGAFLVHDGNLGTNANQAPALVAATLGLGPAAQFQISNAEGPNASDAVVALTDGTGRAGFFQINVVPETETFSPAIEGLTNGGGPAGIFDIVVPDALLNDAPAITASTNGTGNAAYFEIDNPDESGGNQSAAVEAWTNGLGPAGNFRIDVSGGTSNSSSAIEARTDSLGSAAYFQRGPSTTNFNTNPNAGQVTYNSGGGPAALFLKPSGADSFPAIFSQSQGASPAAVFRQAEAGFTGLTSSGATVHVENARSTGEVLNVQQTGSSGSSALVVSSNNNAGRAALFSAMNNAILDTVFMQSNTIGNVLSINHEGTTGRIARFHRDNPGTTGGGVEIDTTTTGTALDVAQRGNGLALNVEMVPPTNTLCTYIRNNHADGRALYVENTQGTGGSGGVALEVGGPSRFTGGVLINGSLDVTGSKNFRIDHPLDPENKYLVHACIESNERKNVYDGLAVTDERGYAAIELPTWFEALNRDFRYQLTVIDGADGADFVLAQIAREIENGEFAIRTSQPNTKVSWQVTGVRNDAYARANPLQVEVGKSHKEATRSAAEARGDQP